MGLQGGTAGRRRSRLFQLRKTVVYQGSEIGQVMVEVDSGMLEALLANDRQQVAADSGWAIAGGVWLIMGADAWHASCSR